MENFLKTHGKKILIGGAVVAGVAAIAVVWDRSRNGAWFWQRDDENNGSGNILQHFSPLFRILKF